MFIKELHDNDQEEACLEIAQKFLSRDRTKRIRDEIKGIFDDESREFEDYAEEFLTEMAAFRAHRFLEAVMRGDKDAAARLLGADNSSRYKGIGYEAEEPWTRCIHGKLFETDPMQWRRMLAEEHAGLIRDERIKDLESQVEGLRQQIVSLEEQRERWGQ